MIQIQAIGNLGRDPERRTFSNGNTAVVFTMAVSVIRAGQKAVEWITVMAPNHSADACLQYLAKGRKVYVQGRPHTFTVKKQNGEVEPRLEIYASSVEFLSAPTEQHEPEGNTVEYGPGDELPF